MEFRLKASMGNLARRRVPRGHPPAAARPALAVARTTVAGDVGYQVRSGCDLTSLTASIRTRPCEGRPARRQGRRLFLPTPIQATQGIHQAESDLAPYRTPSYVEMEAGASRIRLNAADSAIPVFEDSRAQ